jgi:hypothetical protein
MAGDQDEPMMARAFAIHDYHYYGDVNTDEPPVDAMDYLRRVRAEARAAPKVVVRGVDPARFKTQTAYMPVIHRAAACAVAALPCGEWQRTFAANFADLRQALHRYDARKRRRGGGGGGGEDAGNKDGGDGGVGDAACGVRLPSEKATSNEWIAFCLCDSAGDDDAAPSSASSSRASSSSSSSLPPTPTPTRLPVLSITQRLDQVRIRAALSALCSHVEQLGGDVVDNDLTTNKSSSVDNGGGDNGATESGDDAALHTNTTRRRRTPRLSKRCAVWLYALLARLDKPVAAAVAAALRRLYRALAAVRAASANDVDADADSGACDADGRKGGIHGMHSAGGGKGGATDSIVATEPAAPAATATAAAAAAVATMGEQKVNLFLADDDATCTLAYCNVLLTIVDKTFGQGEKQASPLPPPL